MIRIEIEVRELESKNVCVGCRALRGCRPEVTECEEYVGNKLFCMIEREGALVLKSLGKVEVIKGSEVKNG